MIYKNTLYSPSEQETLIKNRSEVIITSKFGGINGKLGTPAHCGYLSKPLVFSAKNDFNVLFDMGGKFSTIRDTLVATGSNRFSQGVYSRQYFTGGGYTKFNLNTRIVSSLYVNNVIAMVESMMVTMAPPGISSQQAADELVRAAKVTTKNFGEFLVETGEAFFDSASQTYKRIVASDTDANGNKIPPPEGNVVDDVLGFSKNAVIAGDKFIVNTANELDKASQIFRIQVGNMYDWSEMVIKDFTATYSRELDDSGDPLYADLVFNVETREILTKNDVRTAFQGSLGSRVTGSGGGTGRVFQDLNRNE